MKFSDFVSTAAIKADLAGDKRRFVKSVTEGQVGGDHYVNSAGMVLCWCPPGSFSMGIQAREGLRQEALQKVQAVLMKHAEIDSAGKNTTEEGTEYPTGVQELLFTSFVIQ